MTSPAASSDDDGLKVAAQQGNASALEALLQQRADVNQKFDYGMTALHVAALHNHADAVSLLLSAKADAQAKSTDGLGVTPAAVAEAEGNTDVLELLRHASVGSHSAVTLNIYDVGGAEAVQFINKVFRPVGTGAFHAGVEVFGKEWSFGATNDESSGIFCCNPRSCSAHSFRESIPMGEVQIGEGEVKKILSELEPSWKGRSYDLLRHNCCHFSDSFCRHLGVGSAPRWVLNLAGAGATLESTAKAIHTEAHKAAIVAAARADKIDKQFQVRETVVGSAHYNMRKVQELNAKLKISETVAMSADYNRRKVEEIVAAGKESRGSGASSSYKFGDFTRGLMSRIKKH
mmetsp:Transcript_31248/g.72875  ORF Transcript_31248/g.72875 Transcript_31248/m.72875 type:complete len:346 (+) Transcript_31248:60-1097(+)